MYHYFVNGRYDGDWVDGRYDGYGIESWARGSRYRGLWFWLFIVFLHLIGNCVFCWIVLGLWNMIVDSVVIRLYRMIDCVI